MKIFHFNILSPSGNFGDDILFYSTQRHFERIFYDKKVEWISYPLRNHTTDNVIKKANSCDLVLVGGGGLLLTDTAKNNYSGWQWACSLNHLIKIEKPLIIYAIGYNRFRGQKDFDDIFFQHLMQTTNKSAFFSVRNEGSKRSLCNYCIDDDKIFVNPCPSLFYTQVRKYNFDGLNIGINLAGDRDNLRYDKYKFYSDLLKVFKNFQKKDYNLHFFNHNWNPSSNCQDLINLIENKSVYNIETVWDKGDLDKGLKLYNSMDIILSMRTHAQIVPFGQRKKIISLISHDKLRWFLEDMNMEYTGIEVCEKFFSDKLIELTDFIIKDDKYYETQNNALKRQASITQKNDKIIRKII